MNSKIPIILLIDDDEEDIEIFKAAIEQISDKFMIHDFGDCSKAISELDNLQGAPNFVFIDLNLPRISGFDCIASLKFHPKGKDALITVYSGFEDQRSFDQSVEAGADLYLLKGGSISDLTKKLQFIFEKDWKLVKQPFVL